MNFYRDWLFPLLRRMDPETAHARAGALLELAQATPPGRWMLRAFAGRIPERPVELWGIRFPNVLGIAAGYDKDVRMARGLGLLGFGHVEVGTLTPRPQPGNPRPRIFRLPADRALINRMGFPNGGVEAALPRLRALRQSGAPCRVGVSLGKQKETPLERAGEDYLLLMRAVYRDADYLAINVSSPNTPGLRELQGEAWLRGLLTELCAERDALAAAATGPRRPLLVKIAPDLSEAELASIVDLAGECGIDGIIATNTTLARDGLTDTATARETGGLSGAPLTIRSTRMIEAIARRTAGRLPVIGVGGVFTAQDLHDKLNAGASLVQIYTALVYEGPRLAGRLLRDRERLGG